MFLQSDSHVALLTTHGNKGPPADQIPDEGRIRAQEVSFCRTRGQVRFELWRENARISSLAGLPSGWSNQFARDGCPEKAGSVGAKTPARA